MTGAAGKQVQFSLGAGGVVPSRPAYFFQASLFFPIRWNEK